MSRWYTLALGLLVASLGLSAGAQVIPGESPTSRNYAPTCTPTASTAAIQTLTFSCTVTGLTTADEVLVNGPAPTSLCPMVDARVSGANTLDLHFAVLTAAICTPTAGTYAVVVVR